jgi:hypothetical protein
MTSGWIDTYTPVETHAPLGAALGVPLVEPLIEHPEVYHLLGSAPLAPPVSNSVEAPGGPVTAGLVQFYSLGGDGHFVVFRNPAATRTVQAFLDGCRRGACSIDTRP